MRLYLEDDLCVCMCVCACLSVCASASSKHLNPHLACKVLAVSLKTILWPVSFSHYFWISAAHILCSAICYSLHAFCSIFAGRTSFFPLSLCLTIRTLRISFLKCKQLCQRPPDTHTHTQIHNAHTYRYRYICKYTDRNIYSCYTFGI